MPNSSLFLPVPSVADATRLAATVGFVGSHLRGMPNMILNSPAGTWVPQPPFVGPKGGADARAVPRPLTEGRGITRLAVLPGVEVANEFGSGSRITTIAVGLSSSYAQCSVGTEFMINQYPRIEWDLTTVTGLVRWFWMNENPNVREGEKACLYQR